MLYDVARILEAVTQPGNLLVAALALGVLFYAFGLRRSGGSIVAIVTALFVAATVFPLGQWATAPLERRFPEPTLPAHIDGIILLGGAVNIGPTKSHGKVSMNEAAGRLTDTLALARRFPDAPVVISGGDSSIVPIGLAEAEATRSLLVADGLDESRVVVEDRSRNTFENAVYSRELVNPKPGQVWVLVTSAMDMPRAIGCFRHVGWDVLPYPADYHGTSGDGFSLALAGDLRQLDWALHEWEGLIAYRLLGRIDSFFPAPD